MLFSSALERIFFRMPLKAIMLASLPMGKLVSPAECKQNQHWRKRHWCPDQRLLPWLLWHCFRANALQSAFSGCANKRNDVCNVRYEVNRVRNEILSVAGYPYFSHFWFSSLECPWVQCITCIFCPCS